MPKPFSVRWPRKPGLGQELRFSRVVNEVAHRRRMRKGVQKVKILELARHSPMPRRCSSPADRP